MSSSDNLSFSNHPWNSVLKSWRLRLLFRFNSCMALKLRRFLKMHHFKLARVVEVFYCEHSFFNSVHCVLWWFGQPELLTGHKQTIPLELLRPMSDTVSVRYFHIVNASLHSHNRFCSWNFQNVKHLFLFWWHYFLAIYTAVTQNRLKLA